MKPAQTMKGNNVGSISSAKTFRPCAAADAASALKGIISSARMVKITKKTYPILQDMP